MLLSLFYYNDESPVLYHDSPLGNESQVQEALLLHHFNEWISIVLLSFEFTSSILAINLTWLVLLNISARFSLQTYSLIIA